MTNRFTQPHIIHCHTAGPVEAILATRQLKTNCYTAGPVEAILAAKQLKTNCYTLHSSTSSLTYITDRGSVGIIDPNTSFPLGKVVI